VEPEPARGDGSAVAGATVRGVVATGPKLSMSGRTSSVFTDRNKQKKYKFSLRLTPISSGSSPAIILNFTL
jgi:hypothetical protein